METELKDTNNDRDGYSILKEGTIVPIIFLDIDGVLNHELWYRALQSKGLKKPAFDIDPDKVILLNHLCKETNSKVVITSTWRVGIDIDNFQSMFNELGGTFEVIGKTGCCRCRVRGVEIRNWISKYIKTQSDNRYLSYIILDDDSDMLLWQQQHFFQIDGYSGLTSTIVYKAIRFLNSYGML